MKQYIGIALDHSGSMNGIRRQAARDYNEQIAALQEAGREHNIDTIVNVVGFGYDRQPVRREVVNSNVNVLQPITPEQYIADGMTPMLDAVKELVDIMSSAPDANEKDVAFLIMVITDGAENSSTKWSWRTLATESAKLVATDRWTITFRVPKGYTRHLTSHGVFEGNVLEWEQTAAGFEKATVATRSAVSAFYDSRSKGITSSRTFYKANLSNVNVEEIKRNMKDISKEVSFMNVMDGDNLEIRPFVETKLNGSMMKGGAFYQLTKLEEVQQQKIIAIRDKKTNAVYAGDAARAILGLPIMQGTIKLKPDNLGNFDIFIQSTSVNRKLVPGTQVLYWPHVGKAFQNA